MKTAGRENPTHGVAWPRNRAHGAAGQNRSRSIKWAEKQEKFQPKEDVFFLDFCFYRTVQRNELFGNRARTKEFPESFIDTFVDQNAHLSTCEQKLFCFFERSDGRFTRDGRKSL